MRPVRGVSCHLSRCGTFEPSGALRRRDGDASCNIVERRGACETRVGWGDLLWVTPDLLEIEASVASVEPSRTSGHRPVRLRTHIPGCLLTASTTPDNPEDVPIMSDLAFSTVVSKSFTQKKLVSLLLHLGASSHIVSRLSKTDAFVVLANVRGFVEEAENVDDNT